MCCIFCSSGVRVPAAQFVQQTDLSMNSQAYQLWLQLLQQLEAGSKFEAAAQEQGRNQQANAQPNLQELNELLSNPMLLVPALLGRVHRLPPWPKPVWRELLKAEVSAAPSHLLMPEGTFHSFLA